MSSKYVWLIEYKSLYSNWSRTCQCLCLEIAERNSSLLHLCTVLRLSAHAINISGYTTSKSNDANRHINTNMRFKYYCEWNFQMEGTTKKMWSSQPHISGILNHHLELLPTIDWYKIKISKNINISQMNAAVGTAHWAGTYFHFICSFATMKGLL